MTATVNENAAIVAGNGTEPPAENVVEALRRVMRDLPAIGKDQTASQQQGGYAYRGIEQITRQLQGLLVRHGVVFVPEVLSLETRDITVNNKPWTDTILMVRYHVYGPKGLAWDGAMGEGYNDKVIVGPIAAIGRDNSDKGANKAMTQAFKYALLQTFCISDEKDDGDRESHEADEWRDPEPAPPRPTPEGFDTAEEAVAAKDAITERVSRLQSIDREAFAEWKDAQAFPFPWPLAACEAMNAELDRMIAAMADDEKPF